MCSKVDVGGSPPDSSSSSLHVIRNLFFSQYTKNEIYHFKNEKWLETNFFYFIRKSVDRDSFWFKTLDLLYENPGISRFFRNFTNLLGLYKKK